MIKIFFYLVVIFAATSTHAATEGHGGHIPWSELIVPQLINFTVFALALIFLLKSKVRAFFAGKSKDFEGAVMKAQNAKLSAEKTHAEVKQRLQKLETSSKESVVEAKKEAALIRERLIKEAHQSAEKLSVEAERSSQYEHEKAIAALKVELVTNAVKVAEDEMRSKSDQALKAELQKEFLNKVAGVRP